MSGSDGIDPLDAQTQGILDIMMPFYGDPALFRAAVESVLAQTDPNWRLVVIDDLYPSTAPGDWLQALGDSRIEYHRNEVNLGVAGNFARCVELADASHTVIIGCDDLLLPGYVERVRVLIEQFPDASYIQPGVQVIDSAGLLGLPLTDRVKAHYRPRLTGPTELRGERLATSLLRGNWTYFPSICWRTDTLVRHGFRADLDVVLDLALQLEIVAAGGTMVVDTEPTFLYRRHSGSVSSWKANDGSRFTEERRFFQATSISLQVLGWNTAARAASRHFSSRMNAITRVPAAIAAGSGSGIRSLLGHAFGRGQQRPSASHPALDR